MLHRTIWDAPSASSKNEVSLKLGTGVRYVTSNCMGRAVRQLEKKLLNQEQEQNMLHRTVWAAPSSTSKRKLVFHQKQEYDMLHRTVWVARSASSKKKVLNQEQEQNMLHRTVWDAPSARQKKTFVLDQEQDKYFLTDSFKKAGDRLALQKMATAVSVESCVDLPTSRTQILFTSTKRERWIFYVFCGKSERE